MVKSKKRLDYYGVKFFSTDDDGSLHKAIAYCKRHDKYGFTEYVCDENAGKHDIKDIIVLDKVYFTTQKTQTTSVIICTAVVDGRHYVGASTYNPNDNEEGRNIQLGREMALARALGFDKKVADGE